MKETIKTPPYRNNFVPVVHCVYEFYKLFHNYLRFFTKIERYSVGGKIELIILDTIELLIKATQTENIEKIKFLKKADIKIQLLKLLVRLAYETKSIDIKKYVELEKYLNEIGKMLGGWINYSQKKNL